MRWALGAGPLAALALVLTTAGGCSDASGAVHGGQPLTSDPCSATGGGHTWTDLYTCYFGPTAEASCSGRGVCHGSQNEQGSVRSPFVCGATKETCFQGVSGLAAASILLPALRTEGGGGVDNTSGNMPCNQGALPDGGIDCPAGPAAGPAYTFTAGDLARISAWIQEGAQDN